MKNIDKWEPTVLKLENGKFIPNKGYIGKRSRLMVHKAVKVFERLINKHATGRLLDLGCGTVPYYIMYKDLVDEIICIDWENSSHKNIHLDHVTDLNKVIPLKDNSIDTILLTSVLEHISEPYNLMTEISRVLSHGGKVIIGVPFLYWIHEDPYDFHRYTKNQLKVFCDRNNLEILTLFESGGPLTVLSDIVLKNLPWELMAQKFQNMAIWFTNTKIGKKIDNRNKAKFPSGYFLVAKKV